MSRYFKLREFTDSDMALRHGIDNSVPLDLMPAALATLDKLDAIREFIGQPIIISSGYRCLAVNRLLKSSDTSDHVKALAVDIKVTGVSPYIICKALIPRMQALGVYQICREFNARGTLSGWCHLGFNPKTEARNRILTIDGAGTRQGIGEP